MEGYLIVDADERDRAQAWKLFEDVYGRRPNRSALDAVIVERFELAMSNYRAEMEHGFAEASRFTADYLGKMEALMTRTMTQQELALRVYHNERLRENLALGVAGVAVDQGHWWCDKGSEHKATECEDCLRYCRNTINSTLLRVAGEGEGK